MLKSFKEVGFKPENRTLTSFEDDYGLEPLDGEEEEEEEGEDDEDDASDDDASDEDMDDSEGELEGATVCVPRG